MFFWIQIPQHTYFDHYVCSFLDCYLHFTSEISLLESASIISNEGMLEVIHLLQMFALNFLLIRNILLFQKFPKVFKFRSSIIQLLNTHSNKLVLFEHKTANNQRDTRQLFQFLNIFLNLTI